MVKNSAKYKPYPAYRPSGVEWLGEIPAHWETIRLKSVLARNDSGVWGDEPGNHEGTIVLRSTEQTIDGGWAISDPAKRGLSSREKANALLAVGDLVVTKSSGSELHIGKTSLVTEDVAQLQACFSNFVQRLRCLPALEPKLTWYVLNSPVGRQQLIYNSSTTTGLANLNRTILGELVTPLPPLPEQRAIAAFLDRETARIEELVARNECLIELLQEKRTALITRAVTRGLEPNAPMKDSGVEWLGEIPAHWEAKRLKYLSSMRAGAGILGTEIVEMGDYPVFGGNGIRGYTSSFTHDGEHPLIGRQGALCGAINLASGRFWATEHAVVVDAGEKVETDYLTYTLIVMSLNRYAQSAAQPGLNIEVIGNVSAPLPPVPEQRVIAALLDQETAKIDALAARVREAIDRLRELRTALISAAVTGRIDVREEAG